MLKGTILRSSSGNPSYLIAGYSGVRQFEGYRGFVVGAGDGFALGCCTPAPIVYTWSGERSWVLAVASGVLGSLPPTSVLMRITSVVCFSGRYTGTAS